MMLASTIETEEKIMDPTDPNFVTNLLGSTTLIILGSFCFSAVLAIGITLFAIRMIRGVMNPHGNMAGSVLAQATILNMWDTGVTLNDNPQVGLLLEIHPAGAPPYQVQTKSLVSRLKIPMVQIGNVVPVKYDPSDPSKVVLALP
jgi:hypothetical protein